MGDCDGYLVNHFNKIKHDKPFYKKCLGMIEEVKSAYPGMIKEVLRSADPGEEKYGELTELVVQGTHVMLEPEHFTNVVMPEVKQSMEMKGVSLEELDQCMKQFPEFYIGAGYERATASVYQGSDFDKPAMYNSQCNVQ